MTALIVIASILLVLLAVLLLPVRVELSFQNEFELTLRYGFLSIPLVTGEAGQKPKQEKKPKKPKKEKTKKKEPDPNAPSGLDKFRDLLKRKGVGGFLSALVEAVELLAKCSKRLLSKLRLKRFDLYLCVAGGVDAAAGATLYGQMSAAVYTACGVLFTLLPCPKPGVTVDLDYQAQESAVDFHCTLSMQPLYAVREVFAIVFGGIPILWRFVRGNRRAGDQKTNRKGEQV